MNQCKFSFKTINQVDCNGWEMMERNSLKMGNHFAFANGRLYMVDCTLYSNSIKEIRINLSNQKDSTTYDVLGSRNVVIRKNKIGTSGGKWCAMQQSQNQHQYDLVPPSNLILWYPPSSYRYHHHHNLLAKVHTSTIYNIISKKLVHSFLQDLLCVIKSSRRDLGLKLICSKWD